MQITFGDNNDATVILEGKLDTNTTPAIEEQLDAQLKDHKELKNIAFDIANVNYISSIGLRLLLTWKKRMSAADGNVALINPNETIQEILSVTGFDDIFTIVLS